MEFSQLIFARESCRAFAEEAVPREDLLACVEAARQAPSACNSQPWRFLLVDDTEKRAEIADAVVERVSGMNRFAAKASAFIVVLEGKANMSASLGGKLKDQHYANLDVGGAMAYLTLAAADRGIGTCILGWFDEKRIAALLGVPASMRIRAVVAAGIPQKKEPRPKKRFDFTDICDVNACGVKP